MNILEKKTVPALEYHTTTNNFNVQQPNHTCEFYYYVVLGMLSSKPSLHLLKNIFLLEN